MSVNKSILESFELEDGAEVYVQSSNFTDIKLSFDGKNQQYMQSLTLNEAAELVSKLSQVIEEVKNGKA